MRGLFKTLLGLFLALGSLGIAVCLLPMVGLEIRGKYFNVGRAPCLDAFGHRPETKIELRIDAISIPLLSLPRTCECSLCRAMHAHSSPTRMVP